MWRGFGHDHRRGRQRSYFGNEQTTIAGAVDAADSLSGGSGNDRLYGGADGDNVTGGVGNDYLQGNTGADTLSGGEDSDVVHGGADNDLIRGDAGNDTISGGAGLDIFSGAAGSDRFVFATKDAVFATNGSTAYVTDEITDFAHNLDQIALGFQVTQLFQGSSVTVAAAYSWASQQLSLHPGAHDVAAVTVAGNTVLFYDSTGAGGAIDSAIKVDGLLATTFNVVDFV